MEACFYADKQNKYVNKKSVRANLPIPKQKISYQNLREVWIDELARGILHLRNKMDFM